MDLTAGRIYLARRIGTHSSKPLFKVLNQCDNTDGTWDAGNILLVRRIGTHSSDPLGKVMMARCVAGGTGALEVGKIYPARRVGYHSSKPLFKVECTNCPEGVCDGPCCCYECGTGADGLTGFTGPSSITLNVSSTCLGSLSVTLNAAFCGLAPPLGNPSIRYYGASGTLVTGSCTSCINPLITVIWRDISQLTATLECVDDDNYASRIWHLTIAAYSTTCRMLTNNKAVVGSAYSDWLVCDPFYWHYSGPISCTSAPLSFPGPVSECASADGQTVDIELT